MKSLTASEILSIIQLIERYQFLDEEVEYWDKIIDNLHQNYLKLNEGN
jgi:hypothetical protein